MQQKNPVFNRRQYVNGINKAYTENPDLTINECIEQILKECGAIM